MGLTVKDFDKCCRCCLTAVNDMKPLFGACLNVMLSTLMNLQVTPIDGYPQQMCSRCILKLSSAHTFYITVLKNQKTLEDTLKAAVKNREIPVIAASYEKIELDGPGKVINTREEESSVYQAACIQPFNPQATITPNQKRTSNTVNHSRRLEIEGEGSSADEESYQCSQCKYSSKDEGDLKRHLQTHLGAESVYKGEANVNTQLCNICGARFRLRTSLHKHLRQHRGRRRCPRCRSSFAERATLDLHLLSHSAEPKPYRCSVCDRSFTQPASRNRHARLHDTRPQLRCEHCDNTFLHRSSLQRHCARAHSLHECPLCNNSFTGKKALDVHMRCHKKEEMDCSDMERLTNNILTESINMQTVTVEFLCLLCTTKFQTRESLEVHICSKEKIS